VADIVSNENTCSVAFVGAGYMAREHIKAFQDIPGVELSGIFSRTLRRSEKLAKDFGINAVCQTLDQLYEKTQANLVVITVPELSVLSVSGLCFVYPWTCLIEKPAGYNVTDAEAISSSAKSTGAHAFVALNRRHYSSTRAVLENLQTNTGPRLIHIQDQEDMIEALNAGQPKLVVENWMYANSIHLIDYLRIFGRGEITSVEPFIRWNPAEPRFVIARVSFSSGDIGLYEAVWNGPGPWAVSVTTPEIRWELKPLEQAAFQLYGSRSWESVAVQEWDVKFKPGLRTQANEAVKAARGQSHALPNLDDSLASMKLVQQIYV